ncbi:MAG: hypothetical protein EXX96DRAFT_473829, partial [Benjaminiella poitrasii]
KRKLELIQLETRYKSSFRPVSDNDKETIVRLSVKPSDPDFPYELDALQLQLSIPKEYPDKSCTVQVLNSDIPKGFAFNLEKGFASHVDPLNSKVHQTLVRQMNWLDRNMESLLQQAPAATVRFVSNTSRASDMKEEDNDNVAAVPVSQQPVKQFINAAVMPISSSIEGKQNVKDYNLASSSKPLVPSSSNEEKQTTAKSSAIKKNHHVSKKQLPDQTKKQDEAPEKVQQKYTKQETAEASKRRKHEYKQLQTRFCDSFKSLKSNSKESLIALVMTINDPEFTHEQLIGGKALYLKYHIPTLYPFEPCSIEIENKQLDKTRANSPPTQKTEEQIEADTISNAQQKDLKPPSNRDILTSSQDSHPVEPSTSQQKSSTAKKATSLFDDEAMFKKNRVIVVNDPALIVDQTDEEDVELENISLFRCALLHIMVKCARCKDTVEVENIKPEENEATVSSSSSKRSQTERWMSCPTCSSVLGIKFHGELVHQGALSIGLVQLAGCTAYDLLPSAYIGTCGSCMADMTSTIRLSPHDPPRTFNCYSCHVKMTCGLGDYRLVKIGSEGGERLTASEDQVMKLKKKKKSREDHLTIGEPLPDQGTCSHYRKSKRWFRFSCCNKLYPCDICHDSKEDHISELAKRHVCGLCSREQNIVSGKPCICGHEFDKAPQKGAFWEGGKGDPHKHKGLGKATSKKHERVGTAGKQRQQHQAESSSTQRSL